jgi:glycosyltransferase involved in cell wall biosynthesis
MKNILYIGPYKENTGLGRSARRYIDALGYDFDINLSIRPIYFTPYLDNSNEAGKDYVEFEDNISQNYDMVIQHGFANCFEYREEFGENVCIPIVDTYNIGHTGWAERINMMDRVIVPSVWSRQSILDAGVNIKTNIIPEPFNMEHFNKDHPDLFDNQDNDFVFYYIAKHKDKNNIKALIAAFLMEFTKNDDVKLLIKTDMQGFDDQESERMIAYDIKQIERSLRIDAKTSQIPRIIVGHYEQEYIMRMHNQCDCYVDVCKAQNFGASSIESMLFDNITIVNSGTGANTYINNQNGIEIESILTNVYSKDFYMENTFTIYEKWREPFLDSIRSSMREAYEMDQKQKQDKLNNFDKQIFTEQHFLKELFK